MIPTHRIQKAAASALSSLLVLGASALAVAQTTPPAGGGARPSSASQLASDKAALTDRVQQDAEAAGANVEALKNMERSDQGAAKKRDDQLQSRLSATRGHLKDDLDTIKNASLADWSDVRAQVDVDLATAEAQLGPAEAITGVSAPHTGPGGGGGAR
jgi:hypothetical protein